jgi:type I restriction enzyme, S subunit
VSEGELPESWAECTMGDIADVVGGGTPKASDPTNFAERGHPWITPADLSHFRDVYIQRGGRDLSDQGLKTSSAMMVPAGTVLMSSRAPIGYLAIAANPVSTNQGFRSFMCRPGVLPEFVYYWLMFSRDIIEDMGSGSTFNEISGSRCKEIPFRLAPPTEQKRIVAKVGELLVRVNVARQRLARVPAILKRFRQAVLTAACEGRLTVDFRPPGELDSGIPKGWAERTLAEIFSVQTGGTPLRKRADYYAGGSIPWVKTGQVQNGNIDHAEEFITPLAVEETNAKVFPAGTILIAMYGEGRTRGQVARLGINAATNQACAALVNEGLPGATCNFVYWFLRGRYEAMRQVSVGGNQPNLSLGVIKRWPILLPPLPEQEEIVRRVEALFELADAIEKRVAAATSRAEGLTQAILAKAFRGELVPTEAELARREGRSYGSATELLERVGAEGPEASARADRRRTRPARRAR